MPIIDIAAPTGTATCPLWCQTSMCQAGDGGAHLAQVETVVDGPADRTGEVVVTLSQLPGEPTMVMLERWRDGGPESTVEFPVAAARCVIAAVSAAMWAAQGSVFAEAVRS